MKEHKASDLRYTIIEEISGFTLVEVIVTLVILSILLTGAVMGIASWNRNSIYKRNNEYAQTLFIAAQTALAQEAAAGNSGELFAYVENGGAGSGVVQGYDASRSLYYLDIKADESDNLEGNRLYQLLCNYVYDQKIFQAAIRLEFDPGEGTVYSLSYTDRVNAFNYSEDDGSDGKTMGINARIREDEGLRRKQMLGYYDTVLSEQAPIESYGKPSFQKAVLENGETLVLRLKLASKYERFMLKYNYGFEVFDDSTKKRLAFYIKGSDLGDNDNNTATTHTVNVKVARFNEKNQEEIPKEYPLQITVNENKEICIVLDAVDLEAARILDEKNRAAVAGNETYEELLDSAFYQNTASILRFMGADTSSFGIPFDTETIYILSRAGLDLSDARVKTTDTVQNPLMGKEKVISGDTSVTYDIQNARHLFNIRFTEIFYGLKVKSGSTDQKMVSYSQTADFGWGGADGLVGHYMLYDSSGQQGEWQINPDALYNADYSNEEGIPFPANPILRENSIYSAKKSILSGNHQIFGLTLYEKNAASVFDYTEVKNYALGLFRWNEGKISHVDFSDVKVEGQNYVGTVCGVNRGAVSHISVRLSDEVSDKMEKEETELSYVKGIQFVGGITGGDLLLLKDSTVDEQYLKTEGKGQEPSGYKRLYNGAPIRGNSYVGGIIGASCFGNEELTDSGSLIEKCVNEGTITGEKGKKRTSLYLGGIVGYAYGVGLSDCESTLGKKDFYSMKSVSDTMDELDEDAFVGDYMGGIIGYGTAGTRIKNCSTKGGVLRGHYFVGGIAGYLEYENGKGMTVLDGEGSENNADIIAFQYAGGILGANASLDAKQKPVEDYEEMRIVKNWKNKGIIISSNGYAGGITGFNAGQLIDCTSMKELTGIEWKEYASAITQWFSFSTKGCTGGLAGYNNGIVESSIRRFNTDMVVGTNYVGGLIGYNDVNGVVDLKNYSLKGGYVEGEAFVGGLIGCNVSKSIFSDTEDEAGNMLLQADPDMVSGIWFVGGLIGGNLAAVNGADGKDWYLQCRTGNQLGKVTAVYNGTVKMVGGMAGGCIGYNRLMTAQGNSSQIRGSIREAADYLVDISGTYAKDLTGMINAVFQWEAETAQSAGTGKMYIVDTTNDASEITPNTGKGTHINGVGEVSGGVMVGGIVGYSAPDTQLELRGLVNKATVRSEGNVASTDLTSLGSRNIGGYTQASLSYQGGTGRPYISEGGDPVNYSYTGGIIGTAGANVTIDNCVNTGNVAIHALGTTYYGNLTEVNSGTIIRCQVNLPEQFQGAYAGGITGKNTAEGEIVDCVVSGTVIGSRMAGGITAENFGSISTLADVLTMNGDIQSENGCIGGVAGFNAGSVSASEVKVKLSGYTYRAGGIAGINRGTINAAKAEASILISGGTGAAGGIAGESRGKITDCSFSGNVLITGTGVTGIGGIIGLVSGEAVVSGCENNGKIEGSPNAGGIVGIVDVTDGPNNISMENCVNHGAVYGKNASGVTGRISGMNNGALLIRNCVNTADLDGKSSVTGGIIGILDGKANGGNITVNDCRNCGKPLNQNDKMQGILGETGDQGSGAFEAEKYLKISECINVSDLENPVASDSLRPGDCDNNYFFTQPASFDGNTVSAVLSPYSGSNKNNAANVVDNDNRTRGIIQKSEDSHIRLDFLDKDGNKTAIDTNSLRISWFRENDEKRTVKFTITVEYEHGERVDLTPSGNGSANYWTGEAAGNKDAGVSIENCNEVSLESANGWKNEKVKTIIINLKGYEGDENQSLNEYSVWDISVDNTQLPPEEAQKRGIAEPLYVKKNPNAENWNAYKKSRLDNVPFIREMSANPCTWNGTGKELYLKIDDQLHWKDRVVEKLDNPQGIKVELKNSQYHVTWNSVAEAYGYEVNASLYSAKDESTRVNGMGSSAYIPLGTETFITPSMDWAGLYLRVSIKAKSIFGEKYDSDEIYYTDENNNAFIKVQPMLPAPEIYLERDNSSGTDKWTLHLENADAYKSGQQFVNCSLIIAKQTGDKWEEIKKAAISDFQVVNDEIVLDIEKSLFDSDTLLEDTIIGFQMVPGKDSETQFLNSPMVTMEQWMLTGDYLKSKVTDISLQKDTPYLTGISPDTLGYDTLLKSVTEDRSTIYRTEMLIFDPQLGTEVVAGYSDTVSGRSNEEETYGSISGVNQELAGYQAEGVCDEINTITVRTYAYASGNTTAADGQSQIPVCYLGSRNPLNTQPLTARELTSNSKYLTKKGTFELTTTGTKARYLVNDGYVIERAGVRSDGEPLYNVYYRLVLKNTDTMSAQYRKVEVKTESLKQPVPVISDEYEQDGDSVTFRWDGRQRDSSAKYQVNLTGVREDGSEVNLYSLKETEQASLTLTGFDWETSYKAIRLEVTRLGSQKEITDSFNQTRLVSDKLYSKSVQEFHRKLSKVTWGTVELSTHDELNYDIYWNRIAEESQRSCLKEYQLYAYVSCMGANEQKVTALKEALEKNYGGAVEEIADDSGNIQGFKVLLAVRKKAAGPYEPEYDKDYRENQELNCSLESFAGWEIELFVNAGAIEENGKYRDSEEGQHYKVKVSERLEIPGDLSVSLTDEEDKDIIFDSEYKEDDFKDLVMKFRLQSNTFSGDYKAEAAVYADSYDGMNFISDDGNVNQAFLDENGIISVRPLAPVSESPCKLISQDANGNAEFTLSKDNLTGWDSTLAGKYLVIRYRATENEKISSLWSDYLVYRLPKVKPDTILLNGGTEEEQIGAHTISRDMLEWKWKYEEGTCQIAVRDLAGKEHTVSITFEKGKEPKVSDGNTYIEMKKEQDKVYRYTIDSISYEAAWPWENSDTRHSAVLRITEEETEGKTVYNCRLILPDIRSTFDTGANQKLQYLFTSAVSVKQTFGNQSVWTNSDTAFLIRIWQPEELKTLTWEKGETVENLQKVIETWDSNSHNGYDVYSVKSDPLPIVICKDNNSVTYAGRSNTISGNTLPDKKPQNSVSGNTIETETSTEEEKETESQTSTETVPEKETETETESAAEIRTESESHTGSQTDEPDTEVHTQSTAFSEISTENESLPDSGMKKEGEPGNE